MRLPKKKGLTIVELLIVITLIALLTVAVAMLAPTQLRKGRDARRKADLDEIKIALYDYYFDHECFPEDLPGCGEVFGANGEPYLKDFPCDPLFNAPYVYVVRKGGGGCKQWFRIFTILEYTADSIIDKIHCRSGCGPDKFTCVYNYGVTSTNTQIYRNCADAFVCAPGGGEYGSCERYEDPYMSNCPVIFGDDKDCANQCSNLASRCENASGKNVPWE